MSSKYRYNPDTLSFQKINTNKKWIWFRLILFVVAFISNLFMGFFILSFFFQSPKERSMSREINNLKINYKLLVKKEEQHAVRLAELERRDNTIYRQFFEANPISDEVRKAGFGGVDRYKALEGFDNSKMVMDLTQQMDELSKRIVVQSKSLDEIIKLASNKEEMLAALPAISPVRKNESGYNVVSGFGMRMHPILKIYRPHNGVDFVAKHGAAIYATGNGKVKRASQGGSFGRLVIIDHGYGYETYYAHLSKFVVKVGQKIKRGDIIGYMGNTGLSVATHLHYEVHKDGKPLNPANFFYGDLTPVEFVEMQKAMEESGQVLD